MLAEHARQRQDELKSLNISKTTSSDARRFFVDPSAENVTHDHSARVSLAQGAAFLQFSRSLVETGRLSQRALAWALAPAESSSEYACCQFLQEAELPTARRESQRRELADAMEKIFTSSSADKSHIAWAIPTIVESFLAEANARARRRRGVYYTPPELARFVIRGVDSQLASQFQLADGLASAVGVHALACVRDENTLKRELQRRAAKRIPADAAPFVRLLDPAVGSGAFLLAAVECIGGRLAEKWERVKENKEHAARWWASQWNAQLQSKLTGFEISRLQAMMARVALAVMLEHWHYQFIDAPPCPIYVADSLAGPNSGRAPELPATVIVGNPPFAAISANRSAWIQQLLRGDDGERGDLANYYQIDGQPLGERKLWLQDDYVKFMRYAQWHIERAGRGIVALVTNHGYLDNPTFRGMRQQLLKTFPAMQIVNLHGNSRAARCGSSSERDENVFAIEQGVSVGFFSRDAGQPVARVRYGELRGARKHKLARLDSTTPDDLAARELSPKSPLYLFCPRDETADQEFRSGFSLEQVMPENVTAPVTARDHLVVAMSREELVARIEQFCDSKTSDAQIRRHFFPRPRSHKYPAGDTRGWRLADARRWLQQSEQWRRCIRPCWYRPFDQRMILWCEQMIDWPRGELINQLIKGQETDNESKHVDQAGFETLQLALIARRQIPPAHQAQFFWIVDGLTLDGVIRSDNRGSESVFPLYRCETHDGQLQRTLNFSPELLAAYAAARGRQNRTTPLENDLPLGRELLCVIYAEFFSPAYRNRFADCFRAAFPRVFPPKSAELCQTLHALGSRLIELHLLQAEQIPQLAKLAWEGPRASGPASAKTRRFPYWEAGRIALNAECSLNGVDEPTWRFGVGGHQVCRKWLKDRRGAPLGEKDRHLYRRIVASIAETLEIMPLIDAAISEHGGWPDAFQKNVAADK